ncbi:hypothetical protein HYX01_00975 [Candidatus Woesearchaeota archaeon]|nr:hypothetical protein [Candidatus Woesearchaeota archaeon]
MEDKDNEPYDILPHRQINELKKQVEALNSKVEKVSPKELVSSMGVLAKSMDSMIKLFTQAAEELKIEEKEQLMPRDSINAKLDEIIEQNRIIADGMIAVSDMISDFVNKQKFPQPKINFPENFRQPTFEKPNFEPRFNEMPMPQPNEPPNEPRFAQGPVAMPNIPFKSFKEEFKEQPKFNEEPKKTGLFGRLKK